MYKKFLIYKLYKKKKPLVGLEPTVFGLEVRRLIRFGHKGNQTFYSLVQD